MAMQAGFDGITVIPVGIRTADLDTYILKMMSGGRRLKGTDYFLAEHFSQLVGIASDVLQAHNLDKCFINAENQ